MSNEVDHFRCIRSRTHIRKDRLVAMGWFVILIVGVIQGQCFIKPMLMVAITKFSTSQHLEFFLNLNWNHHYHPNRSLISQCLPTHTFHLHKLSHYRLCLFLLTSHKSIHPSTVNSKSYQLKQHILDISMILNVFENLCRSTNILY